MATATRTLLPLLEEPGEMCCAPLTSAPLSEADADELASRLKALADPARLRLLSLVLASGESCVCDLTEPVGLSQPTVSHHLKVLVDAGVLRREKRGRWAWFSPVPGALGALAAILGTAAPPEPRRPITGRAQGETAIPRDSAPSAFGAPGW